jgi:endonuclease YncB( thermonuclease family)
MRGAGAAPALLAVLFFGFAFGARADCLSGGGERATVNSITPRAEFALADGRVARLAGLDIPDASRGDPDSASDARAWLRARLDDAKADLHVLSSKTDRWGRVAADISIANQGAEPQSLALGLLAAGWARVRPEAEARECLAERLAAEDAARANGLGVWTDPYYGVVQAADVEDLRPRDGQFAIVEGVVLRVGQGRQRIWLDFGRRGSFSAVVAAREAKAFERAGLDLSTLAGVRIRVRGAMDNRFEIRMAISGPEQIERLSQNTGTGEAQPGK